MKTAKIIISILIVALATTTSAQRNQLKDYLFTSRYDHTVIAYTDVRDDVMIRDRMVSGTHYSNAGHTGSVELIHEKEVHMESWMAEAFNTGLENELQLEAWMKESFQPDEKALELESWMTLPFSLADGEQELQLESWMSAPFANPDQLRTAGNLVAASWE